jgi:hypothetical protein
MEVLNVVSVRLASLWLQKHYSIQIQNHHAKKSHVQLMEICADVPDINKSSIQ